MKIQMKFSDIINVDSPFELTMLKVFFASEDLRKCLTLVKQNIDDERLRFFLFKIHMGLIKECSTLVKIIFKNYKSELREFFNFEELERYEAEYDKKSKTTFELVKNMRNFTFHYKSSKDVDVLLHEEGAKEFFTEITFGNNIMDDRYTFVDEIFMRMMCYFYGKEKCKSGDVDELISDMIEQVGAFERIVANIIEKLAEGFWKIIINRS